MLKNLFGGVLSSIATGLVCSCRDLWVQALRIEATKCYLHGMRVARLSAIGLMGMGLVIALICVGLLLGHAGLLILLPWTVKAKAALAILLGMAYVAVGVVVLRVAMSEKTWMEKSGATRMLGEATSRSGKC
jgi:hypothetical protein